MGCPKCRSENLIRIHRRSIDRILRLIYPIQRLECRECGWSWRSQAGRIRAEYAIGVLIFFAASFAVALYVLWKFG